MNPQRLTKSMLGWGRRSLIPLPTPFAGVSDQPLRVSARVLLPRTYDILDDNRVFPVVKSTQSQGLDLQALSELVTSAADTYHIDTLGSYLFVNYFDPTNSSNYKGTAVIFPDGAVVTWYMRLETEMQLASDILSLYRSSISSPVDMESVATDQFDALEHIESIPVSPFTTDSESALVGGDTLALTSDEISRSNDMLAVSMGLVAAVRLNVIESRLTSYIRKGQTDVNSSISRLSQWRLSHVSERVFEAEKGVHGWRYLLSSMKHTSVPESLWEHESLDRLFDSVTEHFELRERQEDLQNQLTYYSDFLKTVGDYVRHGYSSRLEKIIILIIAIEAAIALRHLYVEVVIPPLGVS